MNGLSLIFLQQFLLEYCLSLRLPIRYYVFSFKWAFTVSLFAVVNWKRGATEKKKNQVQISAPNRYNNRKMLHFQFINRIRRNFAVINVELYDY